MPQRFLELNKTARHNDFSYKIEFSKKHGIDRRGEIHASKVTRKKKKKKKALNHVILTTQSTNNL